MAIALFSSGFLRPLQAGPASADLVVLVNSQSAGYLDFTRQIQPYLDNFGFAYVVQDIATTAPGPSLTNCAAIIIGHRQLDTNLTFLSEAAQSSIASAVLSGVGLVNFDNDLSAAGTGRYQFLQDIFGFTYGSGAAGASASYPPTEPGQQMHFITARHPTSDTVAFRSSLAMPGLALPTNTTTLVRVAGKPLVAVASYGAGSAVQWGSYGWILSTVLGPGDGLDDVLWRSIVWAARKPFVMRGMPHFVTMRVDDVDGPLEWVHAANAVGFKPFLSFMMNNMSASTIADLRGLVTNGNATASIHSFTDTGFFYFNHQLGVPNSDVVQSNYFYQGTQWHQSHGIPISKVCATHYSEIGPNCFAGLKAWGIEYVPIEVVPGTVEYATPGAPWLVGGPFRLFETPQPGQVSWTTYYADWLSVPGHPELNGGFFNIYSEIRDVSSCGEWCPDNDVSGSVYRGTTMLKRSLDSMLMAVLFSHEWYIHPTACCGNTTITSNNWRLILQGVTNGLAEYRPQYVTLDHASQYVRATKTSRLTGSTYDAETGQVRVSFTGKTDLDTGLYVFDGPNTNISSYFANVPVFQTESNLAVTLSGSPTILSSPPDQTNGVGATVTFSVGAGGAWPLSYRWYRDGTNALVDDARIHGAGSSTLIISNLAGTDAGGYSVIVTNSIGSATSSSPSVLTVVDPAILRQPLSQGAAEGANVSFDVLAGGTALTYQWLKGGGQINGATQSALGLTNVSFADAGSYSVIVNGMYGSVTSSYALLVVYGTPTAQSDAYAGGAGAVLGVAAPGVLANDTAPGGGSLGAMLVSGPIHGTLSLSSDGGFTYTPLTNHVGLDTFTYKALNGPVPSAAATVTVTTTNSGAFFSDGFARLTDPGPLSPWVIQAGTWAVTGGVLRGGTNSAQSYGDAYVSGSWSNYSVEARIRFAASNAYGGGIAGRLDPASGAKYALWVYPEASSGGSNVLRLVKFQSWTSFSYNGVNNASMGEAKLPGVGTNWHSVKLAFLGSRIAAFYDGNQVLSIVDTEAQPRLSGGVSVDFWTTQNRYVLSASDVVVRPLVLDDAYAGFRNEALAIGVPGVLANDTGVFSTSLQAMLVSEPAHGALTLSADGHFEYVPGTNYEGPDSFTYQAAQEGNALGTATVTLSVVSRVPVIDQAPTNQTVEFGATATLQARVHGVEPITYQWFWNGTNALADGGRIAGAHEAQLVISDVMGEDRGQYSVAVVNAYESVTSAPALLMVVDPIIAHQPEDRTNAAGTAATFTVGAFGTSPAYQWLKAGAPLAGATSNSLVLPFVSGADAAGYSVVVSNAYGTLTSRIAQLVYVPGLAISSLRRSNDVAVLTWESLSGRVYHLQYKDHLADPVWKDVVPDVLATSTITALTNFVGSAAERYYRLALMPPELVRPRITSIRLTNGAATVEWSAILNQAYRLQYKDSLVDNNWSNVAPDVMAAGATASAAHAVNGSARRYYRVAMLP